ncbi:MAG: MFS transporter [Dehalococcoidales bacterium]|nr:MAG: MFS transporter [Dehalococcoidales bacterium]
MKKIFFGWIIVLAGIFFATYNSVLFVYGFTAFMTPITLAFGWNYAQVSFASSLRGLETGSLDPLIGFAVDRWPARRLMLIGLIIYASGVIFISQATNLGMFYGGFLIVGLGGAISITMVPSTVIARWFKKNIGKASGLLSVGVALGGMFTPLIVKSIDTNGWENTLIYLAAGLLVAGIPLSFLFRDRPEKYGMLPDGKVMDEKAPVYETSTGMGVKEAVKTRAFWAIGFSTMMQMMAIHAVTLHMMPYLESLGLERSEAAIPVTIFSIITIVCRILYGILSDIFSKKNMLAISMFMTSAGLLLFQSLDGSSFVMVVVFAVVYGIGAAGAMPLRTPIIREYFGVKRFGTIFGILAFFLTVGTAGAAPLAGWVYDTRGEYYPIWLIFAGLSAIGMILLLTVKKPEDKLQTRIDLESG